MSPMATPAIIETINYYLESLGYSETTEIGVEYSLAN